MFQIDKALTHTNALLAALPEAEFRQLEAHLELVTLHHGTVLSEQDTASYVYFPTTATVSILYLLENGACPEIAIIGAEGFVAGTDLFGNHVRAYQPVVQTAGMGYRIHCQRLQSALNQSTTLMRSVMECTNQLMNQMAQSIVSSRHQGVFEQVCRRMLMTLDRVQSDTFDMTHEGKPRRSPIGVARHH
jgi:CRP-like cAMP-binding protein